MMLPEEKQQLLQAKQHIQQRQYDAARAILEDLPFNDTAQQWLEKLNQISPAPKKAVQTGTYQSPFNDPQSAPLPAAPPPQPAPDLKPWNPQNFSVMLVMFWPLALIALSLNWKRLGKKWGAETFLISILWLGITLGGGVAVAKIYGFEFKSFAAFFFGGLLGNYVYLWQVWDLQHKAYKKWAAGDFAGMLNHRYNLSRSFMWWLVITVIGTVAMTAYFNYDQRERTFEDSTLVLTYPADWDTESPSETEYCQEIEVGCSLLLVEEDYGYTVIAFSTFPLSNQRTPQGMANVLWTNYQSENNPRMQNVSSEQVTVEGTQITLYRYSFTQDDEELLPMMSAVLPESQSAIFINIWASSEAYLTDNREDIIKIIESIDLKAPAGAF